MGYENTTEIAWRAYPLGLPSNGRPRLGHVMSAVALHTGISANDIRADRRTPPIVYARHLYFYLARALTENSFPQIAQSIARDHTTVIHGYQRIEKMLRDGRMDVEADIKAIKSTVIAFVGGHE